MAGFTLWVAGQPLQLTIPSVESPYTPHTPHKTNTASIRTMSNTQTHVTVKRLQGGITPAPAIELALAPPSQLHLLTPAVPLWLAELAAKRAGMENVLGLLDAVGLGWWEQWWWRLRLVRLRRQAGAALAAWGWQTSAQRLVTAPVRLTDTFCSAEPLLLNAAPALTNRFQQSASLFTTIAGMLATRRLLEDEVRDALVEQGVMFAPNLRTDLHLMVLAGWLGRVSSVGVGEYGRLRCRRCGSERISMAWCARCGSECPRCEDCRNMGRSQGCHPLYSLAEAGRQLLPAVQVARAMVRVSLSFALSQAQEKAAHEIGQALRQGVAQIVVWAACGAGKTEVVYEAIQSTVNKGGRVLLVTPRRDVTAELCARLKGVMGDAHVAGLYGGVEHRYSDAAILVATTHQAIRLSGVFHLVILDECDAFPYTAEPALQRAVSRLAASGTFIQMTATPPPDMRRPHAQREIVYIPARHHGHPLPVPQVICDKSLLAWQTTLTPNVDYATQQLPASLEQVLCQVRRTNTQLLIFVPARRLVDPLAGVIRQAGVTRVGGVHSSSKDRDATRVAFASGNLEVVVATTVFERGLTFPMADVAVFLADTERVFNRSALVQMAGRVGRTNARPDGQVWFLCRQQTATINGAISDIVQLNALACQAGLLVSS